MKVKVHTMLPLFVFGLAVVAMAQPAADKVLRTAQLESRVTRDASGCPTGVDIWLSSTTDTIQGLEIVLQWDRSEHPEFVRGLSDTGKKPPKADSTAALLKPADPRTQIPIQRQESLISSWEFVEARSADGNLAKIIGVAKLLGQADPAPILPGASGRLLWVPISIPPEFSSLGDSAAAVLTFDPGGTRMSTHRGVLFGPLTLRPTTVELKGCVPTPKGQ